MTRTLKTISTISIILLAQSIVSASQQKLTVDDFQIEKALTFQINLDLPPIKRWNIIPSSYCKILSDFQEPYTIYIKKEIFKNDFTSFNEFIRVGINYLMTLAPVEFY